VPPAACMRWQWPVVQGPAGRLDLTYVVGASVHDGHHGLPTSADHFRGLHCSAASTG
jgi:hypothetical protein